MERVNIKLLVAVAVTGVALTAWAGQTTAQTKAPEPRQQWEFKHVEITLEGYNIVSDSSEFIRKTVSLNASVKEGYDKSLAELGRDGWELVSVVSHPDPGMVRNPAYIIAAYLKRPLVLSKSE